LRITWQRSRELALTGDEDANDMHRENDMVGLAGLCVRSGIPVEDFNAQIRAVTAAADMFVKMNWDTIAAVARALMHHTRLNGEQVRAIIQKNKNVSLKERE